MLWTFSNTGASKLVETLDEGFHRIIVPKGDAPVGIVL